MDIGSLFDFFSNASQLLSCCINNIIECIIYNYYKSVLYKRAFF